MPKVAETNNISISEEDDYTMMSNEQRASEIKLYEEYGMVGDIPSPFVFLERQSICIIVLNNIHNCRIQIQ